MSLIKPFKGVRPTPKHANDVIAPPYDVVNRQEAKQLASDKPLSFLHISKPEIDLADNVDDHDPAVYQKGRENFQQLFKQGILQQDEQDCYYVYRLTRNNHSQTGLVAAASVQAYHDDKIKRHELTRPVKVNDRTEQILALDAHTGPVMLAYHHNHDAQQLLTQATTDTPVYSVTADDGVQHEFWVIKDQSTIEKITNTFCALEHLYIADGHHRTEAASQVAKQLPDNPMAQYFLSVIFPDNELTILSYNRVVKDHNGYSLTELLEHLQDSFIITPSDQAVVPNKKAHYGMYIDHQWYHLELKTDCYDLTNPVGSLDVSLLTNYVIKPILGIHDPRHDPRIDFVGGGRGVTGLEKRVDSGDMTIAFSLYPTSIEELFAVSDHEGIMPPKSTWFEPKLNDGLISLMFSRHETARV